MLSILVSIFIIGYVLIAFEQKININKSAIALIAGVLCWMFYILLVEDKSMVNNQLSDHLASISGIVFFLLGAMTIVELIDSHEGFTIITSKIIQTDKRKLLWIIAFLTFFLSAVLDNLTTSIVMVSLLRKLVHSQKDRLYFVGMIVIAANAGGAWTPIGDVTTTMLWIGGQITTVNIMTKLFLPSLVCLLVPLIFLSFVLKGKLMAPQKTLNNTLISISTQQQNIVFFSGILVLILVPVFKMITALPPYMGMLIGLGILWVITEFIHKKKTESIRSSFSVVQALRKIDTSSILFFLGILLSIAALESSGILHSMAVALNTFVGNINILVPSLGIFSAIVDNVPLVAAAQGMYSLSIYPTDHYFWEFLAYCAGTGGSILIIGSAAGVAAMGMEKISFFWYAKKISLLAFLGYFAGALVYILQNKLIGY